MDISVFTGGSMLSPRILVKPVLHIASHNINVGDGAITDGIRNELSKIADEVVEFSEIDILDFSPPYGNLSIQDIDFSCYCLTLVGGGGIIDGKAGRIRSGNAFPMSGAELRRARFPIAYVAVGYNLYPGQVLHCKEALVEVLKACADRDIPFSVRNDGSLERLREQVGNAADHVVEIPDPAFFIQIDPDHVIPQMRNHKPTILIQVAGDNLDKRLRSTHKSIVGRFALRRAETPERQFINKCANLITWLIENYDADVVLAPHITRDLRLTSEVVDRLPIPLARKKTRVLGIPHPRYAPQFFAAYAKADLVIGMRGHSAICSVGLRIPFIAISTHAKVSGFMEKCGLSQWVTTPEDFEERVPLLCHLALTSPDTYFYARDTGTKEFPARFRDFMKRCWRLAERP